MIRTVSDTEACRKLWNEFSPQKDTWDDWDLVFAFHDQDKHCLRFLVHEDGDGQPDGLVPLVHDTVRDRYTLMGGSHPDGRVLWLRFEDFGEFFEQFPECTVLFDLQRRWVDELLEYAPQFAANFGEPDSRYFLVPADFGFDFNNHIDTFSADRRQRFLADLRNVRKREPVIHWSDDNLADFFIELVNRSFGVHSDYVDEANANEVRRVVAELARSRRLKTLSIDVDGDRQAVSLSLLHNNKMVALYAASNRSYSNLGKLLNVETAQEACRLRVDEISFMTGMQWKADWKMKSEPCITLRKPAE